VNYTIAPVNVNNLYEFDDWCVKNEIKVNYIVPSFTENFYHNEEQEASLAMDEDYKKVIVAFLKRLRGRISKFELSRCFYDDAINMLENGGKRKTPCVFLYDACILDAYGDMYYCMHGNRIGNCLDGHNCSEIYFDRQNLEHRITLPKKKCPRCFTSCFLEVGIAKYLIGYLNSLIRVSEP